MAYGRRAAGLDGCGGVQARRPGPHLPQVHLRRIRGEARPTRTRAGRGRRPGGSGRVPRAEHLLGPARGALGPSQGTGEAAHNRPARRRRDGCDRTRQPGAQGRAAQGLRPSRPRQAAARSAHRHDQQHQGGRRGRPLEGRDRPRLRVLPVAVRQRRGQEGRRVLHAALRGQAPGRDAGALPGSGLRSLLRLLRHVRPVGRVHPRPHHRQRQRRQGARRHLRLRPGVRTTRRGGSPR